MPIVTKSTKSFEKGTPVTYTLDKAALIAHANVAGDAYFVDSSNWEYVTVKMKSDIGLQGKYLRFDASLGSPADDFETTAKARETYEVESLVIYDFDGGTFVIKRADLVIAEFDIVENTVPTATALGITGIEQNGQLLTLGYTYGDADDDLEGVTTFQWYRADDGAGLNRTLIGGAEASTYTLIGADVGKFINCSVVPLALTGPSPGLEVESPYTGAIAA